MTTGQELLAKHTERSRLDVALDRIMQIVDNHAVAWKMRARYGNQWGDEDRLNATRGMIEEVIRMLIPPSIEEQRQREANNTFNQAQS